MAVYTFDCANRIVQLTSTADLDLQDLYSRWKDEVASTISGCAQFMRVVKEPLVGAVFIGPYYFIMNDWRIRPFDLTHSLNVSGTIIKDENTQVMDPFFLDTLTSTVSINQVTAVEVQVVESRAALTTAQDEQLMATLRTDDARLDNLDAPVSEVKEDVWTDLTTRATP